MKLVRRAGGHLGEAEWYRCTRCDSGQMRSLPNRRPQERPAVPDAAVDEPDPSPAPGDTGRRWIERWRRRR